MENVFLSNNFISITKNRSVEWEDIAMQLREFILDFINNNKIEILDYTKDNSINLNKPKKIKQSNKEIDSQIISLIDNYIKPAVESDGGAIEFHSFENGTVTVVLKGSCSGCPSSQATLKNGVEQLLKDKVGDKIKEVVALNDNQECIQSFFSNSVSFVSTFFSSGIQQSTGHTAAHCGSS